MSDAPTLPPPDPKLGTCKLTSVLGLKPLIQLYGDTVDTTQAPKAPVTDPLQLFQLEEAAKAAGDLGVEVRQMAASVNAEVSRIVRETRGPLSIERALFINNDYETVYNRWMSTIDEAANTAYGVCEEVRVAGLELSAQFKDKNTSHHDMLDTRDTEIGKVEDALEAFRNVITRINGEVNNERKTIEGALEFHKTKFLEQYEATAEGIRECLMWDYPEAPALDERAKAIYARAFEVKTSTGFGDATRDAAQLTTESSALVRKYDEAYRAKLDALMVIVDRVQKAVDGHKSWVPFMGNDLTEEHRELTQGKVDAAKQMAESGRNIKAIEAAMVVAREAELLITAIDDKDAKATLKSMNDDIKVIANMITKYKDKRPNDGKATQKKLDDVKAEIRGLAPDDAKAKVTDLLALVTTSASPGDWTTYQGRGQLQAKWEADYTQKAGALDKEIAKFNKAFQGTDYTGTLVTKVKALRGVVTAEANETTGAEAQKLVDEIETQIALYLPAIEPDDDNIEAAVKARDLLTADQTAAMAEAEAKAKAKEEFEALLEDVEGKVEAAKLDDDFSQMLDAVATARADYEACKQMLASAKTTAEKSEDYVTATNLVNSAAKDLRKLEQRSTGELFDDLQKMGRVWQIGAMDFAKKAMELELKMRAAVNELEDEDEKAARKIQVDESAAALKDMIAFFDSRAFDDVAARFASTTDAKKRKRDREEVLRRVRLYRDAITGNPVMKSIVNNPFGVSSIATSMYAQLKKIELMTLATL
ncbi:MAG: hypothetical protein AAGB05_13340 [Pseudomonadota bacterium]